MSFTDLLGRFSAAAAAHDSPRFAALFTADACYDDYFWGPHRGHDAIAAMLDRFHEGGEAFRWQFIEPVAAENVGYAAYCFSYVSKQPESAGALVVFEGMCRLRLRGGLIEDYAEVFDRGVAFVQLGYETPRVRKLLDRYARAFRDSARVAAHLAWRASAARSGNADRAQSQPGGAP